MKLERGYPYTAKQLLDRAYLMSLFWIADGLFSALHHEHDWLMLDIAMANIWVIAMFIARYLRLPPEERP